MSEKLTIQQLCDKINRDIHISLYLPILKLKGAGKHEKAFTSLDVIEDTQNAIEEFDAIPEKHIQNRTTLYIYGVMQSLYCQQDGLFQLYKTIVGSDCKNVYALFDKFDYDKNAREQRDDIAGHPANRKCSEFYFIAKGSNTKYKFTYGGYTPDFKSVDVDLRKNIEEQKEFVLTVLKDVEMQISKQVNSHKENFKQKKLANFSELFNQSYKFISDAIISNKPTATIGIKSITKNLSECKNELLARYHDTLPASVSDILRLLEHIITRFSEWNTSSNLYKNVDAEIFLDSYEKNTAELNNILFEIDEEFNHITQVE